MFCTWSGKSISPNNVVRRWIALACDTLGIQRVISLTLRRTYSSWAHEKGVPAKVIAQLMGHAKIDMTLNVYTQVIDGSLRRAADTVVAASNQVFRAEALVGLWASLPVLCPTRRAGCVTLRADR